MLRLSGPVVFVFAIVHLMMSFVLFLEPLSQVAAAGPLAGSSWSMSMLAAFWFLVFTWPVALLGILMTAAYGQSGDVPAKRTIGGLLMVVPILSGVVLPASGLWAFLIPGMMLFLGKAAPVAIRVQTQSAADPAAL